jgi:hemolysin activation/secretion protein
MVAAGCLATIKRRCFLDISLLIGLIMLSHPLQAVAQVAPNAGSILRDMQRSTPELTKPAEPSQPFAPAVEAPIIKAGQTVLVTDFHIKASLFPEATLKEVVKDYLNRQDSLGDLEEAAAKISRFYRDNGYLARAYLPKQVIHDGLVEIVVLEGRLGGVSVDPGTSSRLSQDIAVGTVLNQQEIGAPIRPDGVSDAMANLNSLPGVAATATLVPGRAEGESDILLKVNDTPLVSGVAEVDNGNPRAIGRLRNIDTATINDAVGVGDQEAVTVLDSATGKYGYVSAQTPITYSGLTVGADASDMVFSTAKDINSTEPSGLAITEGLFAKHPLYRDENAVLQAQLDYDHKVLINQVSRVTTSNGRVDMGGFGVNGSVRDHLLGTGGTTTGGVTGNFGRLDLSRDVTDLATDQASARSQGDFTKLTGNLTRTQPLMDKTSLAWMLSGQWAEKNLGSSEKFSLGGPSGVRAYPVNEATGDLGWLSSVEVRHNISDDVQVAPFFDIGGTEQHAKTWAGWQGGGTQPNAYTLQGVGLWSAWTPTPELNVKATAAQVLGENPGRTSGGYNNDGTRQRTLFWIQASAAF